MAEVSRAESWSDVEVNGGVRRAILGHPFSLTETVGLLGEHTVTLELELDHPAVTTLDTPAGETNFDVSRVIRLQKDDATWSEHRIAQSVKVNGSSGPRRRIVAQSIWLDLATRGIVSHYIGQTKLLTDFEMLGLTAVEHWNRLIYPALVEGQQSWWQLEMAVDASVAGRPVDIRYTNYTPLAALLAIASSPALGGLEMSMTASAEEYTVVMRHQVGDTAPPLTVRARRNLVSLSRTESQTDQATRIYPVGPDHEAGRVMMGEAEWALSGALPVRVPHPTEPTLELVSLQLRDEAGGPGPLQFPDQLVRPVIETSGYYILSWTTTSFAHAIYSTNYLTQTVTISLPVGRVIPYNSWHRVKFLHRDVVPGDTEVNYLDHPEMRDRYHVLVGDIEVPNVPPTANMVPNPLMRQWDPGALLPTDWRQGLPGIPAARLSRATAPGEWNTAGQALRVQFTGTTEVILCPQSFASYALQGFVSFFARLKAVSGSAKVWGALLSVILDADGDIMPGTGQGSVFPNVGAGDPDAKTTMLDVWQDIGVAAAFDLRDPALIPLPGGLYFMGVAIGPATGTTSCEVLIDSVQVTNTSDQRPLLEGNAGVRLWQAGNDRLLRYGTPAVAIDADLLDLNSFDAVRFPYDEFVLGGSVRVVDPTTGVDQVTRITGWDRDHLRRANTRLDISSARGVLTSVLAQRVGGPVRAF